MRVKCAPTSVQEQTYSFEHKAPLAVFDFDGTLINGNTFYAVSVSSSSFVVR